MLRKIRIALAAIFWVAVTLLFIDTTGLARTWFGWMAKIQFLPAVLALNVGVIIALVLLTFVFGRIYCSVICPLGITQDIISWIHGKTKKKNRFRFQYKKANNLLRYIILSVFIIVIIAGLGSIAALLAPYSAYGRIVSSIAHPATLPTIIVAAVTFVAIAILSWKDGRIYCNTICPVGSLLGLISRFSLFGPVIDADKCRGCKLCGKQCKSSCIDMEHHSIDYSRCVDCMDCIDTCKEGAIKYRFKHSSPKTSEAGAEGQSCEAGRRAFLIGGALAVGSATLKAQEMKVDGGLAAIEGKKIPQRETRIVPAGAVSIKHLSSKCTACQLCISNCPEHVLRPSTSLTSLMQPEMSFDKGYCRTGCTRCSELCPAGAILPITEEEKTSIHIGHAVVDLDACIAATEGESCGNCARHCPAGAIKLVHKDPEDKQSPRIPTVDEAKCIGCGACEHLCPVRPISAIHIEGHSTHIID